MGRTNGFGASIGWAGLTGFGASIRWAELTGFGASIRWAGLTGFGASKGEAEVPTTGLRVWGHFEVREGDQVVGAVRVMTDESWDQANCLGLGRTLNMVLLLPAA